MKYLLGFDLGSSSVKTSIVEAGTGQIIASAFYPDKEAPIASPQAGWAEQNPADWWEYAKASLHRTLVQSGVDKSAIAAIGIAYQMHGLVCMDEKEVLRPAIIWCDSRAVQYGTNFTAGKLRWVKDNEPDIYARIHKILLPGDYLAYRMSGKMCTTLSGVSEMDWRDDLGVDRNLLPEIVPTFGIQGHLTAAAAEEIGLQEGTPICYRAGDQPNNALSLNVLRAGEVAATGGTSGAVFGVVDKYQPDPQNRVNAFIHVNGLTGILLCINGAGILNAWVRRTSAPELSYSEMNDLMESVPIGADGLTIVPFGNGAERVLANKETGCSLHGIRFNRHNRAHIMRAAQESIVFAFAYGLEVMRDMGMKLTAIKAPYANLFLTPVFRQTLAAITGVDIILYETDGSTGAARGAGIGAGIYKDADEAFEHLKVVMTEHPASDPTPYLEAYNRWKQIVQTLL